MEEKVQVAVSRQIVEKIDKSECIVAIDTSRYAGNVADQSTPVFLLNAPDTPLPLIAIRVHRFVHRGLNWLHSQTRLVPLSASSLVWLGGGGPTLVVCAHFIRSFSATQM